MIRYMPSYPLLCLAAQFSQRVYTKPAGKEKEEHVGANLRMGTKAMVIKSVPIDDMNTIVFAIRGSQTFMDWAVNLKSAPVSPDDFLVSDTVGRVIHSPTTHLINSSLVSFILKMLLLDARSALICTSIPTNSFTFSRNNEGRVLSRVTTVRPTPNRQVVIG